MNFGAFDKIWFKSKGSMASRFKMILWVMRKGSYSYEIITIGFPTKNWSHNMYNIYINKRESLSVRNAKNSAPRGPILTNKAILESSP